MGIRRLHATFVALVCVLLVGGISGACDDAAAVHPLTDRGGTPSAGGTIEGRVTAHGHLPAPEPMRMGLDPTCLELAGSTAPEDDVVVAADGAVKNAFVYIKSGLDPEVAVPVPTTPVVLDQRGCRFVPRVVGVRVGQPIEFTNSDPTEHDVHGLPGPNGEFNRTQPVQGMRESHVFTTPEIMLHIKCDLHPWMSAYVGVLNHPFFAVTDADGRFTLTGVPDGQYTIEMWHERLGVATEQTAILDRQTAHSDFSLDIK